MKKTALAFLALALAGLVLVDNPLAAQDAPAAKTISLATLAPPGSTWMRIFDSWNREIRRRSNQTLQLRIYGGGVQGDESEVIRKIRNRRLDATSVTAVGLSQVHRPALVFQLPGILRTYEQLDAARTAIAPEMNGAFEQAGFVHLGWADVGQSRIFSKEPVRVPADLAQRRPIVWRDDLVLPSFYRLIHANPVTLQIPEALSALQTNRADTFISPPVAAVQLQWASQVRYMMDLPLTIVIGGTIIGKPAFDALTPEQQTTLRETAQQFHTLARRNLRNDERNALATITQRGIQVTSLTEAQKQEWIRAGDQTRQQLAGQIADAALVARVQAFGR